MYIGSASLGFSPVDRYVRPPVPINVTLCLMYIGSASLGSLPLTGTPGRLFIVPVKGRDPSEAEPMYIKHSVSLIGTGGLTYLSTGENPNEAEPMYIKYSVSLIGTGGLCV
jgi:hypothetical protein